MHKLSATLLLTLVLCFTAKASETFELCFSRKWLACSMSGLCETITDSGEKRSIGVDADGFGSAFIRMSYQQMENDVQIDITKDTEPTSYRLTISTGGSGVKDPRHIQITVPSDDRLNEIEFPVGLLKKGKSRTESYLTLKACSQG